MESTSKKDDQNRVIVRICPACGVVNPAGPSDSCPHLQLIRFDELTAELDEKLTVLAEARRRYNDLLAKMKSEVLDAARNGDATVETPRKMRPSEVDGLYPRKGHDSLTLTSPKKPVRKAQKPPKKKRTGAPPVDPRQLDLLALSAPKGDA